MSEKPNTVAIGVFIVGAALIAISAILFISGSGWGGDKSKVVMVFEGSVKGLTVGAPIALRGVQIGQVTDIHLIFDTDSIDITMTVEAEIDGNSFETRGNAEGYLGDEMIARGLRAQLSLRVIARHLRRPPSTISREVRRNGGCISYRAARSDQAAWERALRPKSCKLAPAWVKTSLPVLE